MLNRARKALPAHPTAVDPRTGQPLRPLGVVGTRVVWPILGGAEPDPEPKPDPAPDPDAKPKPDPEPPKPEDRGYPLNTPVADMTAEQQIAYWKYHSRKHENALKDAGDLEELRARAARADELEAQHATESQKAAKKAADEAVAAERKRLAPSLVAAEFRAAAKGVLTDEQRDALLEDLDLTKYLTAKGEVDVEKVTNKVAAFAPPADGKQRPFPDLGQGKRGGGPTRKGAAGAAEADRRFPKTATTQ